MEGQDRKRKKIMENPISLVFNLNAMSKEFTSDWEEFHK
jgi:hypothetical protein